MDGLPRTLLVFSFGGAGACLRYLVSLWLPATWLAPLPLAILLINLAGAAGLGVVYVLADEAGLLRATTRLAVAVGLLGGFTTWSTFMVGAVSLLHGPHVLLGVLYVALSLTGGPLAVAGASTTTRWLLLTGTRRRLQHAPLVQDMAAIEAEDRAPRGSYGDARDE